MPSTAQEVYNEIIQSLSSTEQLRLSTLIINELVQQHLPVIDQKNYWTEQDQADVVDFSLAYAASIFPEVDNNLINQHSPFPQPIPEPYIA